MAAGNQFGYLGPSIRDEPGAAEFDKFLHLTLRWSPGDFPSGIAWDAPIPPKAKWAEWVERFNVQLAQEERAYQAGPDTPGQLF